MEFWKKKPVHQEQREKVCRVKVRHGKDGSMTKEISGNCTKEQLEALASEGISDSARALVE